MKTYITMLPTIYSLTTADIFEPHLEPHKLPREIS